MVIDPLLAIKIGYPELFVKLFNFMLINQSLSYGNYDLFDLCKFIIDNNLQKNSYEEIITFWKLEKGLK
jgi:hypothetical protein